MTLTTVLAGLVALVLVRLAVAVIRFARLPVAARRHYLPAQWARFRWRHLARNLNLAYVDQHRKALSLRHALAAAVLPWKTSVRVHPGPQQTASVRWPRAKFRADAHGLDVTIKTIPKVGRAEFEQAAPWLADAWKCHRVQIAQPGPGRLLVRGLRRDPLAEPLPMADVPSGVYDRLSHSAVTNSPPRGQNVTPECRTFRVYLGRDEWGADRWVSLADITAAVVGGLPGTGKTTLASSLLCQLAPSPAVRLAIADGQGGADFTSWRDRAYAYAGDDRADAAALLEDVHGEMRARFATVFERTGHRNAWHAGPTPGFPLLFLIVDEAHSYLDETLVKGDRQAEAYVRTCRAMLGQLVRRGRSVMVFTLIISQKPTSDAVPSFISANAGLRLCFGVQTVDGAVATLGESIRQFPTLSPVGLQGPGSVGVLVAQMATAGSPFTRLRVPEVTEEAADARARESAGPGLALSPAHSSPLPR